MLSFKCWSKLRRGVNAGCRNVSPAPTHWHTMKASPEVGNRELLPLPSTISAANHAREDKPEGKTMTPRDIKSALEDSLSDLKLSRGERRALETMLEGIQLTDHDRNVLRAEVFRLAHEAVQESQQPSDIIDWMDEALKVLRADESQPTERIRTDACFSPGDACVNRINSLIRHARSTIDICVFTITDNRISKEIQAAHHQGIRIRIVSDNDKANDLGSDVAQLAEAGVPVRIDNSPYHMHHKFAIFDGTELLTGSYNWTLGAARDNQENLIVTGDTTLLRDYQQVFDGLWNRFSDFAGGR